MRHWQINKHVLRTLKVGVWIAGTLFILLYLVPLLLFRIPAVQREAAQQVSHLLTQLFDSPVKLDRVDLVRWTDVEVHRVEIQDTAHRPILSAERLVGGISLIDLITTRELRITSARLFSAQLTLIRDPETGRLNVQHIIDHLSRPSSGGESLPVDIHSIIIRDMQLALYEGTALQGRLSKLSTRIRRLRFAPQYIGGAIDELSFQTDRGLVLSSLTGQAEMRGEQLTLSNVQIQLPNSEMTLPLVRLALNERGLNLLQQVEVGQSKLVLGDLSALQPAWASLENTLSLRASYQRRELGRSSATIRLLMPQLAVLDAEASLSWDSVGRITQLASQVGDAEFSVRLLDIARPFLKPQLAEQLQAVRPLGRLAYQGQLSWQPDRAIHSEGLLSSDQGRWEHDLSATFLSGKVDQLAGRIETSSFDLAPLIPSPALSLGRLSSHIQLEAAGLSRPQEEWRLRLGVHLPQLAVRGQTLHNLRLELKPLGAGRHEATLSIEDQRANLTAQLTSALRSGSLQGIDLGLQIRHLQTDLLGLLPPALAHQQLTLSGQVRLSSLDVDHAEGLIHLHQVALTGRGEPLSLQDLSLQMTGTPSSGRTLSLESPYLAATMNGHFRLSQLWRDIQGTLYHQFPALAPLSYGAASGYAGSSDFSLQLSLRQLPEAWKSALKLPIDIPQGADLQMRYAAPEHQIALTAQCPELIQGGNSFRQVSVELADGQLQLAGNAHLPKGRLLQGFKLQAGLHTDSIHTDIDLGRDSAGIAVGHLALGSKLRAITTHSAQGKPHRSLSFELGVDSSDLRIHSEQWHIAPARLVYGGGELHVYGLDLASTDRRISISGAMTSRTEDHLVVGLKNVNLLYILQSAGVTFDMIDTDLTGTATANLVGGKVVATAQVTTPSFIVKGVDVGALRAGLTFDSSDGRIMLEGLVTQAEGGKSGVYGYIRPAGGAGIDLNFQANRLRTDFIGQFMDTLFSHVRGRATGNIRLFGIFDQGVTVEGAVTTEAGDIGVRLLGTNYHFSGPLSFTPTSIQFNQLAMTDDEGHTGELNGTIQHEYFDHFNLDLTASKLRSVKVLQTTTRQQLPLHGTAYGSGSGSLRGQLPKLQLDVDLRSEEGTNVTLDFNSTDVQKEDNLFTFRPLRPGNHSATPDSIAPTAEGGTELSMRMNLHVTPRAQVSMKLGSSTTFPNEIKARCEGELTIDVPHSGSPTTYGSLTLQEGQYVFSFEQLARKRFTLHEGGKLEFRGDPMQAAIDLKATYALTANIADLDASLSTLARRTHMPISCAIQLSGIISRPDIRLGIELPSVEPEIERRMQSLMNTEDEKNRQFLYLMTLGKFYSPEERRNEAGNTQAITNGFTSLATTTLSDQLSRLLGNLSKDFQLGTNIRTSSTAFEDTDIELLFSSSLLNNRLIINGNVGYHENPFLAGKYIGEFDLEYKLNPSGSLRLKGYSHYNTMYQYLRQSMTTQGLGFMFQKRFDSLGDLIKLHRGKKKIKFVPENSHNL